MNKDISNRTILMGIPSNQEESDRYANTLATGNYPIGLDGCFTVGISGGCGWNCFVFQDGDCNIATELLEANFFNMTEKEKQWFLDTYPQHIDIFDKLKEKYCGI